jgi:signal transduction histidine kinase
VSVSRRAARSVDERTLRRAARRIGLQTAAGFAVLVVGLAAVSVLVVLRSQHQADDQLIEMAVARADDVTDPPAGVWLVIRHGDRQVSSPGLPTGLPDEAQIDQVAADHTARTTDFTAHDREYRVDTRPRADGDVVQALLDLSADHAERYRLLEAFLVSGVAGLVIAAAVGAWLGRRAVAPMAETLALQRRFVADASHELRTPLTLLSTRAQLIRRELGQDGGTDTIRADVQSLVTDARQLSDILDDMLVVADRRESPADEVVRLPVVVAQAVESARPLAEERGVDLTIGGDGEVPSVAGAQATLRRAVTALLDNAIRHASSQVRVSTSSVGGDVVVDVADDGPGVEPEMASTLFTRFVTARGDGNPGARRRYGLGLALVSDIATQHGGSVSVLDTGRAGATLRIRLPVRPRRRDDSARRRT